MKQLLDELQKRLDPTPRRTPHGYMKRVPRIVCADGFSVSVQADIGNYCSPRNDEGPWDAAEVGFPSEASIRLMEWAEDAARPTETVYGYVPLAVIALVIEDHGGFKL